jgi:hypothetical protein
MSTRPKGDILRKLLSYRFAIFIIAMVVAYATQALLRSPSSLPAAATPIAATAVHADALPAEPQSPLVNNEPVTGHGTVIKILSDDNKDSRHQRFILRLESGQTVLVAHNIDLAQRIDGLTVGSTVDFKGIYVSNDKGGVIHWTHRDPQGHHEGGWLKWNGMIYQ